MVPPVQPHVRWPPGYPLLLAPFFTGAPTPASPAFWHAIERAMTAQVLVGATLPLLVVVLARRIMPPAAAWCAGLLSACCPMLVATCAFLVTEIPFTVMLLLALLALSRQLERPTPLGASVAGLLCGYLVLMRSFAPALVAVAAAHLAVRGRGAGRGRAALVLVAVAAGLVLPWPVRQYEVLARGAPPDSYLGEALATSLYPDLRYGSSPRGYPFLADQRFHEFSTSPSAALAETWRRIRDDPWPNLRWQLAGKWLTLWEFDEIQSPGIVVYAVQHGLFRPAFMNPRGGAEPLAVLYWGFPALYCLAVPLVFVGAVLTARGQWDDAGARTIELLYLVLATSVVLHSLILPLPRYQWPMRPILYLLALATLARLGRGRPGLAYGGPSGE